MTTPAKRQAAPARAQKAPTKVLVHYRVVKGRTGVYDWLIRYYSRSPYTHAEFCWPLENPRPIQYLGAQPSGGVQVRPADYLGDAPFDTFAVEVTPEQANRMRMFLLDQIGKPYDFRAIAGMVFQWLDKGKTGAMWFCSELLFYAFAHAKKSLLRIPAKQSDRVTPRDVAISTVATLVKVL